MRVKQITSLVAVLLLCGGFVVADPDMDRTVTVTCDPLVTPDFALCYNGESLTVINGCSGDIAVGFNSADLTDTLPPEGSVVYGCTGDYNDCYTVAIPDKDGGMIYSSGCGATHGGEVPTLSEWGLIIFSLLILSLVTVVVTRRRTSTSAVGAGGSITISGPVFVPARFVKTLTVTLGLAIAILVTATAIYGSVPLRDIIGTIISAGIVAYIAHLWIVPKDK